MMHHHALSPHTVRSPLLSRALLDRDLDPFPLPRGSEPCLHAVRVPVPAGDFDDDDPRWRRKRRASRAARS